MKADELVDLYDAQGRVVGVAPRSRVRAQNLRHGATGVLVRNSRGQVFVHRRTDRKDVYPGRYDIAAGGVLQSGEDPDECAAREVFEELGVAGVPLHRIGVASYRDTQVDYVAFLYETIYDGPIRLQPEEVAAGEWLMPRLLLARLDDPAWSFVPDTTALLRARVEAWAGRQPGSGPVATGRDRSRTHSLQEPG